GAGLARLRLPWWPIHPVLFLVWGSYPAAMFAVSILLGWVLKLAVVRVGGARALKAVTPIMVGVIVGELLATLLWLSMGAASFYVTGETPP
ncbi:DUF6784 domain-containing protein, partial [Burkholderia sp. SIMBA_024]|uniref:DUF6784 domain-containing protein n=1 Tax=Burkholderia sp. SIMBA_024 TaxID=3085768 RepID=UPI00397E4E1E